MKTLLLFFIPLALFPKLISAQMSNPTPLRSDITISRIMTVHNGVVRMALDPVSHSLFYIDGSAHVYKIIRPAIGPAYDSLMYTVANHGVDYPQCIAFHDSILYLSGNNTPGAFLTTGIVRKGILHSNGTRSWSTVMLTEPHQTCGYFDHKFSGMVLSPSGDSITINSGSRGDHGEVETNAGLYPNLRNVPLTAKLFRVSANDSTYLHNDSAWLASSGCVYAQGIRNTFSMAYDGNGELFGLENSDDRDDNEEINWLRRGRHYGFPYQIGDSQNPQQFSTYNCSTDIMINHYSKNWRTGGFHNDPSFPPSPVGVVFETPIKNTGPDCDKFRDPVSGGIKDASDLGISIGTFTAHRSPLGLVFDVNNLLIPDFRSDAFMLSWTKGLDSTGCSATPFDTSIGPFVDPSQDLVHLHMTYNSGSDSYTLSATRIIDGFKHPVDAKMDGNKIYVIENGYGGTSGLFEVTMPLFTVGIAEKNKTVNISCFPNPAKNNITFKYNSNRKGTVTLKVFDIRHAELIHLEKDIINSGDQQFTISTDKLSNGIYIYELMINDQKYSGKLEVVK